ncbi:MAG: hypothetical protein PHF00_02225 [Elusimicrobia bacterium]|nr:hypothetical protein [Elusimicrobiota bacterium]
MKIILWLCALAAGAAWAAPALAAQPRIFAEPLGPAAAAGPGEKLILHVDHRSRVAARFRDCGARHGAPPICREDAAFVFPQLRADKERRFILFGDEVVASRTASAPGFRLSESFKLSYEIRLSEDGPGLLRVFLERVPAREGR